MTVNANNDRVSRDCQCGVQGGWRSTCWVSNGSYAGVCCNQLRGDQIGVVSRRTKGQNHLDRALEVLVEDRGNCLSQVPFLVQNRHDHRYRVTKARVAITNVHDEFALRCHMITWGSHRWDITPSKSPRARMCPSILDLGVPHTGFAETAT